ncbi:MAG: carboxyl transferase domain-containing protein [Lachnospiraceae bacterium]|nr:carboxyl transferase domain-containing protein [Lachnospiraceae bacterium]
MSYVRTETSASKRIIALLDRGSFVEIGGAITARATDFNMTAKETPADGVITGYGVINGNLVYVYSQDATVLQGAIGEMHAKKIAHIYDMAMKMGAPIIGLVDSAGLRLQEATDALHGFGSIYMKQTLASGVVPQITAIFGNCGGGLAIVSALSDFTFMEKANAKLFVNAPNAIEGNIISKCDNSSATFQSEEAGQIDKIGTESEILEQIRMLISIIPSNNEDDVSYDECLDDLNRVCPDITNAMEDASIALSIISDNNQFYELKKDYAKEMVTGFIRLNGMTIGAIANRIKTYDESGSVINTFDCSLSSDGCKKASGFVNFCDAFNIPILTLTNVAGYKANMYSETRIAKESAKLTFAFANASVPKVNVIIGKAFGSAYITMNSKSIGADIVYAWPTAEIGMMDAKLAAKIMYADENMEIINQKVEEYRELQTSPASAARRGYIDAIIAPADTRKYVIGAFEMLFTKREDRPSKKHGTV